MFFKKDLLMQQEVTNVAADAVSKSTEAVGDSFGAITDIIAQSAAPVVDFFPQLLAAVVLLVFGYLVGKVISWIVRAGISKSGLDNKLLEYTGSKSSVAAGKLSFYGVMAFVVLAVLKTLNLDTVSEPIANLMNNFFDFIPNVVGSAIVLAIFGVISKVASTVTTKTLASVSADEVAAEYTGMSFGITSVVGQVVQFGILLTGFLQAVDILGLDILSTFVAQIWQFTAPILFGSTIIAAGAALSSKISGFVAPMIPENLTDTVGKYLPQGILALFVIVGLRQTGLVDSILDVTVPIVVAGVALAGALRYGLSK